jgi:phospholipid transport system transporter-binding protein
VSEAQITEASGGRLAITGDLTFGSVPALWEHCCSRFAGSAELDIDLSGIQRSDSAGLALLVECVREARQTGKNIRFFNIPAQMLAIARVSSLDQVLPLHRDT